jgi:hypothetical protein
MGDPARGRDLRDSAVACNDTNVTEERTQLIEWRRALYDNLMVAQLFKNLFVFYENRSFINPFDRQDVLKNRSGTEAGFTSVFR